MLLTLRDVAELFKVPEATVYEWVASRGLPTQRIKRQYRFSRDELLEWATRNDVPVPPGLVTQSETQPGGAPGVAEALAQGGIHYGVGGVDRRGALAAVVALLPLPDEIERGALLEVLVAREELASTGIGNGIAIPHVRTPIVLDIKSALISLCFLAQPIEFGALDGQPVRCLFTLVSPTVRVHLQLLSRLAFVLQAPTFRAALQREATPDSLLAEIRRAEAELGKARPSVHPA
jgi:PTS system nitrogen regulatory IIA component